MTGSPPPDTAPITLARGAVAIGGRPVVRGVDLVVPAGEFLAVLGPNGSGKSTLVRALTGLLPLASGELRVFGTPSARFRDWHRIGYVPQRASAGSGVPASVWEVVASGRLTHRRLLAPLRRADRAAIDDALDVVGLSDRSRESVAHLSGGQQQRVLIARALAGQPELFFLDEPTAGVDAANQVALAGSLATLKQRGATLVLVAHELGPLAPLVDRAIVLRDGRVVHDGAVPRDPTYDAPQAGAGHLPGHLPGDHHPPRPAPDHAPHLVAPLEER